MNDILIASGSGGGSRRLWRFYWTQGQDFIYQKYNAGGGTQTRGGGGSHYDVEGNICDSYAGSRLKGGDANNFRGASAGGGGGGYYGGGGGVDVVGGGGGSSFVRSDSISFTFYNGSELFKSPTGALERGHHGHGTIIIQPILVCSANKFYFDNHFLSTLLFILLEFK
ncbi:Eggshell protein 2A precursor-related protein [Trichomonas vaginalis G3]|uniref:receptor protein-tyrosine kinase n=1 Tax=Trichomonas vaginalis (strain ATCC PRA-98 / G3) TaxID=412133 RepID=A2FR59_TRIV3|nr:glycine-rich protein family [Trichomonas vaginalis G3]EAX92611.1 Eggshell protein 2A precursor-related protein [Trichomonas vaginalis G3]KAI5552686.1 glycine-rich protein family [Trichomonas vaginalis G3]|eukprot:XP_001305541.1 Eggshell protein 2A precursor-related protein [Trichomonas vaginalis G3]